MNDFTTCPFCRHIISSDELFYAERCRHCGRSLHGHFSKVIFYGTLIFSCAILLLIVWKARPAWPAGIMFGSTLIGYGASLRCIDLALGRTGLGRKPKERLAMVAAVPAAVLATILTYRLLGAGGWLH